ncbi:MAG: hypothetical protein R6X21_10065 [Candidatus Aminicenantes bacterium]
MPAREIAAPLYLALSIVLCLAGIGGFVFLFARDFNIYWLILSPVIITLYQIPAVYLFWLYKRARLRRDQGTGGRTEKDREQGSP